MFYKEANNMSPGWGNYLRKIDILREKFDSNSKLNIKEACWILYAEKYVLSSIYLKFQDFIKNEGLENKKFVWPIWYGMFCGFSESIKETK